MTYRLLFKDAALKEWRKLDDSIREQFKKKLRECLAEPRVEAARPSGMPMFRPLAEPLFARPVEALVRPLKN